MDKCTITFWPIGKIVEVAKGTNLMEAARKAGVFLDAPCGGKGHCGKCRVMVKSGQHKHEFTPLLTEEEIKQGIRLACLTWIQEDMTVELTEVDVINDIMVEDITSRSNTKLINRTVDILKRSGIMVGTGFKIVSLTLPKPTIDDNIPDLERAQRELKNILECEKINWPIDALRKLPVVLRNSNNEVTLTILKTENGYNIINIAGEKKAGAYGLCVDVGTTTVAACLVDIDTGEVRSSANSGNLQMQYGGDVINRIIYSTKENGLEKLNQAVIEGTVNQLLREMKRKLAITEDEIVFSVFAGNTTMAHLLLGVCAENIRLEPYIPAFRNAPTLKAGDISLGINKNAPVFILPNVASYVGGDIVAGVLASGLWDNDETVLFMDLGTNGEIVLGNKEWMLTCACSAGPAFEGGEISCGMRAASGAIDEVKIDSHNLKPILGIIGNTKPKGICGSGIIDLIAEMFLKGIIDMKGKINQSIKSDRIRHNYHLGCFEYVVAFGDETSDSRDITINEIDIDNFLRAKGAVYSGARTLLNNVGISVSDIDKVIIAGGIGQNLDIRNSIIIGLLPDIPHDKFEFIGNSSLTGAYACLISDEAREKVKEIADSMTYIELSADPAYMEEFISACFLPHTDTNLFPSLKKAMNL
ncbi:MAG: DUF4445 domain-containing protein [Thermoanaerobacteraceae bacterium]|nr:DUF4445 domain-containing protein [Thermoanaerobacteraceae bacterium]